MKRIFIQIRDGAVKLLEFVGDNLLLCITYGLCAGVAAAFLMALVAHLIKIGS
jgi:hypothetical protein